MDKITNYILNENKQLQEQEITPASVIEAAENAGQIGPAKHVTGVEIDLNDFDEPGKYYFGSGGTYANMPDGVTNGYLTVNYTTASGPVQQMLIGHNARIYLRTKGNALASWTEWTTIANLSDIPAVPGVMTGASATQAGTQGIVPAPAVGKQGSYLMGDATWGRDADVLAAIEAGQIGNAKYVQGENLDLDDFNSPGKYYFGSGGTYTHMPSGVTSGYLTVNYVTSSGPVQQMLIGHNARIYLRTKGNALASWTEWTTIANLSDIPAVPGVMTGASATQAGTQGIVPAPAAGKQGSYLMGNGTWGRDADVLAAIAAGQIGVAKHVTGVEIDLNDFDEPGKYYFGSGGTYTNMPDGVTNGYLTVNYTTESGPVQQILIGHNARIYLRTKGSSSASWTAWTTIANLSDMPGVMTGATESQAGTQGLVPAPAAGKQGSYLMGNGTWGRDADVLAAIAAGQIGPAKYVTGVDIDLDEFNSPGKYYFGTGGTYTNMPSGVTSGYLTVNYVTESGPVQQILIGHNARIYLRTKGSSSASWTAWTTIANLSDMPGVMTGATESQAGTQGIVPAPAAGKQGSYLMGNGTWGRDADVLAAIAAGQIGNITMQGGSAPNLNDYKTTGCYMFSASQSAAGSNFPASNLVTWLVVLSNGGSPTKQIALIAGTDAMYQRYYAGSVWGTWRRIGVPMPQAADGAGQWKLLLGGDWDQESNIITPAPLVLPSGGTWAYFGLTWRNDVVAVYAATYAGVAAGGTQIMSAEEHRAHRAMIWRVA